MRERLHLQPGYTADRAHLRRPVTLADDMTLVALCESLERMEPRAGGAVRRVFVLRQPGGAGLRTRGAIARGRGAGGR
jgi:hypothetical protein